MVLRLPWGSQSDAEAFQSGGIGTLLVRQVFIYAVLLSLAAKTLADRTGSVCFGDSMNKQPASKTEAKAKTKAVRARSGCSRCPIPIVNSSGGGCSTPGHFVIPGRRECQDAKRDESYGGQGAVEGLFCLYNQRARWDGDEPSAPGP